MTTENLKTVLEIISLLITIIGVPIAIYLYFREKRKERIDREYGTYNALDDKYIDFLNLCLSNNDLGIYDISNDDKKKLTEVQKQRRNIIFEILICILERAFLMYKDQSKEIKKSQWDGWNLYMEDWMENKYFRASWGENLNSQYDKEFLNHMNFIYQKKISNTINN